VSSKGNSTFIKPFLAKINKSKVEILIGDYSLIKDAFLPIYVIPDESTPFEILQHVTDYFLFDNELTNSIISNLLNYLEKMEIDETDRKRFISSKLKISSKSKIIETYKKFSLIDNTISEYLVRKKAPLKVWEYLTATNENCQLFLKQMIVITKPSLSNFLEVIENIVEYQKISDLSLDEIITEVENILEDESEDKLPRIRENIQNKRYPTLTSHRKEVSEIFIKISKPNNLNLQFDPNFEKKEIRGFFTITKDEEIKNLQKFFSEVNIDNLKKTLKKL